MNDQKNVIQFSQEDISENSLISGFAYFQFFLPLVVRYNSDYARFHANQALLLLIAYVVGGFILIIIPVIGWMLLLAYSLFLLVVDGIYMVSGLRGMTKEIPIIGKYRVINKPIGFLKDRYADVFTEKMASEEPY